MSDAIGSILLFRSPREVAASIVGAGAIEMTTLLTRRAGTYEGLEHQHMDKELASATFLPESHSEVVFVTVA
jgi:hypothetical protein